MVNTVAVARIFIILFYFIRQIMIDDNNISDVIIDALKVNFAGNLFNFELL